MTVTPQCNELFQSAQELYQRLLRDVRELVKAQAAVQSAWVGIPPSQATLPPRAKTLLSVSFPIPILEPLALLQAMNPIGQPHAFFSQPDQDVEMVAIDALKSVHLTTPDRFSQAQGFIDTCLEQTWIVGDLESAFAGPHFFCSFTFFPEKTEGTAFPCSTVFLPRYQVTRHGHDCTLVCNLEIGPHTPLETIAEQIWQQYQHLRLLGLNRCVAVPTTQSLLTHWTPPNLNHFTHTLRSVLQVIRRGDLDKVVLAHTLAVETQAPLQWVCSLRHLQAIYPDCYVFSIGNGHGQVFLGASPERLLSIQEQGLVTDAIAGSAPRGKTHSEDDALARALLDSPKDLYEHQIVVDFIRQQLVDLGLSPQLLSVPTLLQLSNIQHLHTLIQAQVPKTTHPLAIVAALHPTPAVAGTPRQFACEQIQRHESFDRGLYAAPLGWVNYRGNSEFIVGIRSALIDGNFAHLYAGAGIVAGSDPEKELAEIQLKFQALLRALVY